MVTKITRDYVDFVTRPLTAGHITGATFDHSVVGGVTPSTGAFTTLIRPTVTFTGGAINGTPIGASTPSTGKFTNFTTTGIATGTGATLVNMNFASYFPSVTGTTGYLKLPNGLIIQWITAPDDPADTSEPFHVLTWPTPFLTACFAAFVTKRAAATATISGFFYQTYSPTTTTVGVQRQHASTPRSGAVITTAIVFGVGI